MTLAEQYATALRALIKEQGESPALITGLTGALTRRGHEKLLPQIVDAYEKLQIAEERLAQFTTATPAREERRVLYELYRMLTH